jgi:hypothetical protein
MTYFVKINDSTYKIDFDQGNGEPKIKINDLPVKMANFSAEPGVYRFSLQNQPFENILDVDDSIRLDQIKSLRQVKAGRDNGLAGQVLESLGKAALDGGNLMAPIIDCVKAYCSIGEICGKLREQWGEYRENFLI